MLLSIENARKSLPNCWFTMSGMNVAAAALFFVPLFEDLPTRHLLILLGIAACTGLVTGLYLKYRSACGTATAFFGLFYFLLTLPFLFAGGGAAGAVWMAGRPDLCWPAFYANAFFMALALLGGMYREAKNLEWWGTNTSDRWKSKLEKHIDYSKYQIIPGSVTTSSVGEDRWTKYGPLILAAGPANFALLFELYGGGRNNTIFIAAPIMTGVLAYLNLRYLGPAYTRLLLLRKLEKESGRRFVNADLEQIQELRRTFFLSRWLMKDYKSSRPIQPIQLQEKRTKGRS